MLFVAGRTPKRDAEFASSGGRLLEAREWRGFVATPAAEGTTEGCLRRNLRRGGCSLELKAAGGTTEAERRCECVAVPAVVAECAFDFFTPVAVAAVEGYGEMSANQKGTR